MIFKLFSVYIYIGRTGNFLVRIIHFCSLQGEDPSDGNPNFWDEFFLLKVLQYCMSV